MQTDIGLEQARALARGIDIPVRPAALQQVMELQENSNADLSQIAKVISQDVSLSAGVLKTVNSPLYGLRNNISSIQQAVNLLGLNNVINIVMGIALRLEISGRFTVAVERFWDTANDVAMVSAGLSKSLSCGTPDEAYILGLFHDCGIPLMMMKYPNYVDILKQVNETTEGCFTDLEDQTFNTNHTTVGFYVAKSWRIPSRICSAILNHHNPHMLTGDDTAVANLLAVLKLAETITHSARRLSELPEWMAVQEQILEHLRLSARDFNELREEMIERLCSSA